MNEIRFGKSDALAVLFLAALVGGVVLIRIFV